VDALDGLAARSMRFLPENQVHLFLADCFLQPFSVIRKVIGRKRAKL
jgi:hypothetical protein